jgi:hypothetical protein
MKEYGLGGTSSMYHHHPTKLIGFRVLGFYVSYVFIS